MNDRLIDKELEIEIPNKNENPLQKEEEVEAAKIANLSLETEAKEVTDVSVETEAKNVTDNTAYSRLKQSLGSYKFRAYVHVYVTKNNVSWAVTDVTNENLLYKISGGYLVKRGTDKNSSKTTLKSFEKVIEVCKQLNIDHITFTIKSGYGTKKSPNGLRSVAKLLQLFKDPQIDKYYEVINKNIPPTSTVRLKGGRRGRRV